MDRNPVCGTLAAIPRPFPFPSQFVSGFMSGGSDDQLARSNQLVRRHERLGWYGLALFIGLGLVLEAMHGLKIGFYLENPIRRQQWTLSHAHGSLVALIHLLFAMTIRSRAPRLPGRSALVSTLLTLSIVLLPGGFFLGGIGVTESDPGVGVWLVPLGGLLLLLAVLLAAGSFCGSEGTSS